MQKLDEIFNYLENNLKNKVYLVGGSTRDYLLKRNFNDFDFATVLTPNDIKKTFPDADYSFEKFGIVNLKYQNNFITLATFRKESNYVDSRHPQKIEFVTDLLTDSYRRDFTINSIYLDSSYNISDPQNGLPDLKNKIIRMIGDPEIRLKEDPLRILRAYRFSYLLNFTIEKHLQEVISNNFSLLHKIKIEKINMELNKLDRNNKDKLIYLLKKEEYFNGKFNL